MAAKKTPPMDTIFKIRKMRSGEVSLQNLVNGIFKGDKVSLSKAITLLESSKSEHATKADLVVEKCLAKPAHSLRIGVTGVPGVGKSSFIEVFGTMLTSMGKRVAVLAVDPSSALSKGSILGDKTRMEELSKNPNAFIRPSPAGESPGGVARRTREAIILCEAAGYDVVLVETIGVGQSEIAVHSMVDFFLLLKLFGAGDELQGIKRGIMEMADAIAINKADGDNLQRAKLAQAEFSRALHLYPPKENGWNPKVLTCSATNNKGIHELWQLIKDHWGQTKASGHFDENRNIQNKNWFFQEINEQLAQLSYAEGSFIQIQQKMLKAIEENRISPFRAAKKLVEHVTSQLK